MTRKPPPETAKVAGHVLGSTVDAREARSRSGSPRRVGERADQADAGRGSGESLNAADSLILAQIDELYRKACGHGMHDVDPDTMHLCTVTANRHRDFTPEEEVAARMRVVTIVNSQLKEAEEFAEWEHRHEPEQRVAYREPVAVCPTCGITARPFRCVECEGAAK